MGDFAGKKDITKAFGDVYMTKGNGGDQKGTTQKAGIFAGPLCCINNIDRG